MEKIIKKGQEAKRKILTGMLNVLDKVKISTSIILNMCILYVEHVKLIIFFHCSGYKGAAGHKLVTQGHAAVVEGWQLFEEAVGDAGPSDLPNLLRQLKGKTTPTQMPPPQQPLPMEVESMPPPASPIKKEEYSSNEDPVIVMVGVRKWACSQCNTIQGSWNGCDAHIRQAHTGKALVCPFCSFSSYNLDSMQRHEKEHKWIRCFILVLKCNLFLM